MTRRTMLQGLIAAGAVSVSKAQTDFTLRSESRLVLLDVSVRDRNGMLVSGLTKDKFSVSENGHVQPISVFAHDDAPVTIGILVDESGSMRPKRNEVLAAAELFIEESNPHDEIFILNFNDHVKRGLPEGTLFSDDKHQLRAALHRGAPQGKTALNDALEVSLKQLVRGHLERKAAVLITDGGDNASVTTRRQTLALLEKSSATVYSIGIYDDGDPDRDPAFLKQISALSGGEAHFPNKPEGMNDVCRRIAKDIRARYSIGYVPQNGVTGLRRIRVNASDKERGRLIAVTRSGYRYEI